MRKAFVETLRDLMNKHDDIVVFTPDMGHSVFEGIQKEFPKRFFNTGVTEQATIGIATGLSFSGYKVYVYAQAIFVTLRCIEQIRLDVCYHNANVKIIGTAAGFWLNQLGFSHYSLEDISAMRLLPKMTIFSPGDPYEAAWATTKAYETKGPVYLRIGKPDRVYVHKKPILSNVGDIIPICKGKTVAILATGGLVPLAEVVSSDILKEKNKSVAVYSVLTIQPLSRRYLIKIFQSFDHICTIEEHSVRGGLGSLVAELLAENHISSVRLTRFGVSDGYIYETGSREYLLKSFGLSASRLKKSILYLYRQSGK